MHLSPFRSYHNDLLVLRVIIVGEILAIIYSLRVVIAGELMLSVKTTDFLKSWISHAGPARFSRNTRNIIAGHILRRSSARPKTDNPYKHLILSLTSKKTFKEELADYIGSMGR